MSALFNRIKTALKPGKRAVQPVQFNVLFTVFQKILGYNNYALELMAEMGTKLGGSYVFDRQYIHSTCHDMAELVYKLIYNLNTLAPKKYTKLFNAFDKINKEIEEELAGRLVIPQTDYTMPFSLITGDFTDVVGAKNANLAEVKNVLELTTPEGFAITTRAFQAFMDYNRLDEEVFNMIAAWRKGGLSKDEAGEKIQDLILKGTVPPELQSSISSATDRLYQNAKNGQALLALRSSARSEDSEHSFAGQYLSLLNQPRENILDAYKSVIASTFSGSAMEYRFQKGFAEHEEAMAVACQFMVDAAVSGVLYTLDPRAPEREVMMISAAWGLGAPVMAGKVKTDLFTVDREAPHSLVSLDIVRKEKKLAILNGGGTDLSPVREDLQTKSCLPDEQIRRIAAAGLRIERHFKKPQDIEWALDRQDRLYILQARPLNIKAQVAQMVCDISAVLKTYPVIFENKGMIAAEGIAAGKVFVVKSEEELNDFPQGAILVTPYTSPRLAKVIKKANAIITDVGSPTGHMATIAREFRVPTIVNTEIATQLLHTGQEITVDARQNVVYAGTVKELCYYEFSEEAFEETYEYRLLRRVLKKIAPLNLLDPSDYNFVPEACKTFHDITRFVHEKAVEALISLEYANIRNTRTASKKLKFDIPLDLVLIDIGGGIEPSATAGLVEPADVLSVPMSAFLKGLSAPGAWNTDPVSVDFGSFMSSLTKTFSFSVASPRFVGQNLAVLSKEYVNINLRLGYHFNMIVAYISENPNDNYAYFRFLGGVTDIARRSRRAQLLSEILSKNDFRIDVRGDLVVARIKKLGPERMLKKMYLLGMLVGFTRQLDVKMTTDQNIKTSIETFNKLKNGSTEPNRG